jgi:hypothetical protein
VFSCCAENARLDSAFCRDGFSAVLAIIFVVYWTSCGVGGQGRGLGFDLMPHVQRQLAQWFCVWPVCSVRSVYWHHFGCNTRNMAFVQRVISSRLATRPMVHQNRRHLCLIVRQETNGWKGCGRNVTVQTVDAIGVGGPEMMHFQVK